MEFIFIGIAGIIGTGVMTLFLYLLSYITSKQMKVVKILGTMLTNQVGINGELSESTSAITVGIIAHYTIGIIFGLVYLILWKSGIGEPNLIYGIIIGLFSGILGFIVWWIFFTIHPNPPSINLKSYFWNLIIGHIIFGVAAVYCYILLQNLFN